MSVTEIFYFSGSGNSLFVARELQKRCAGAKLTPIVSLLAREEIVIDAENVGFVFPLHGMTLPVPVKHFLKRAVFNSGYFFAVVTRGGSRCYANEKVSKLLRRKGKSLNAAFVINMANSDPKLEGYQVPTDAILATIEAEVLQKLDDIARVVQSKETCIEQDTTCLYPTGFFFNHLILLAMRFAEHNGAKKYFYANSECVGCGLCEKVCLSGKIVMDENKPYWRDSVKCSLCYACINFCPRQAAQIRTTWYMKSYTDKNGRYPHPYASAEDIAKQKYAAGPADGRSAAAGPADGRSAAAGTADGRSAAAGPADGRSAAAGPSDGQSAAAGPADTLHEILMD